MINESVAERVSVAVELRSTDGRVIARQTATGTPWSFRFAIAPGHYQVAAPHEYDSAVAVQVVSGSTSTVALRNACK